MIRKQYSIYQINERLAFSALRQRRNNEGKDEQILKHNHLELLVNEK